MLMLWGGEGGRERGMERRRETEVWDSEGRGGKRGQPGLVHEWRGRGLSGVREERTVTPANMANLQYTLTAVKHNIHKGQWQRHIQLSLLHNIHMT